MTSRMGKFSFSTEKGEITVDASEMKEYRLDQGDRRRRAGSCFLNRWGGLG